MVSISDSIEEFLITTIGDDAELKLSRNELAIFFSCAPSQINYVLSTRFTPDRGYKVESKRGGGGCVKLIRIVESEDNLLMQIYEEIRHLTSLTYSKCRDIVSRLMRDTVVTDREGKIMLTIMNDKSLAFPVDIAGRIRVQMFKEIILELSRRSV